ncbi:MAG TPA: hypothetical protein P5105_01075 [Victivallales bacterium]|nr:hypothetical protein [Victivallales bacterium]HRR29427.1 hypothetical protein [Victivallales bacterium]HRU00456.1 hypothetical protein [Victivallales bacterium]
MKNVNSFFVFLCLFANLFFFSSLSASNNETNNEKVLYRGIFRVNTNISAGEKSIDEIISKAKDSKIDFIVLSDQFLVKCIYGIFPFRNIFYISKERNSISKYGIKNYIDVIEKSSSSCKRPVIIRGVDIAPHYFWELKGGKIFCRQYSQQLTIFGEIDENFLYNLPVIHNSKTNFSIFNNIKRLLPLLLIPFAILLMRKRIWYEDNQGNKYYKPTKIRRIFAFAIFAISILWTLNNRPFIDDFPYDQYKDYGEKPYQELINYVKNAGKGKIGIAWSAPEAKSINKIADFPSVYLITEKYPHVLLNTDNYDGFAAIYGDARTVHLPGKEWDNALLSYCKGKRKKVPFAFGELDYHKDLKEIPFDYIKTFIFLDKNKELNKENIINALLNGNSYASRRGESEIIMEEFSISNEKEKAYSGEIIELNSENLKLYISGFIEGKINNLNDKIQCIVIINGEKKYDKIIESGKNIEISFCIGKNEFTENLNYLRVILNSIDSEIISNPIFIKKTIK